MSQEEVTLINVDALVSSLQLLSSSLDKATQKGLYTLSEAFKISVSISNLEKGLQVLDNLQKTVTKQQQQQNK